MALVTLDSQQKFLQGSSDLTLHRDAAGKIGLIPDNLVPNSSLTDLDANGEPVGFDLSWNIEKIVAWMVNVSRPGTATMPPKLSQAVRQVVSGVPPEEGSWTMEEPWVAGIKGVPTSEIVPPYPALEAVASGNKGFAGGTYGWAWGVSSRFGPTTTTGVRFFTLANGEVPLFPVPDAVRVPGVVTWDIYMTRVGGGSSTLSLQRRVPIDQIREETYKVNGPWRKRGKPPASNRSGVGNLAEPKGRDSKLVGSGFDMPAGRWQPAVQVEVGGGTSLLGRWGDAEVVKGDRERVKVQGPAPANVEAADAAPGFATVDPREVRPSGKHPDNEYLGQEVDFEESRLVAQINAERGRRGLPVLVLNKKLNRAAYRFALGSETRTPDALAEEEGYGGRTAHLLSTQEAPEAALSALRGRRGVDPYAAEWDAVGVARERNAKGNLVWVLALGDDPELPDDEIAYYGCESFRVEHVEEDGTVYSAEIESADARLSFDLVSNNNMDFSYNGSFDDAVNTAARRTDDLGVVSVKRGGNQVAITDGNLDGAVGRTYSDRRIVFDAAIMRNATQNARRAVAIHEFFHGLGFDHVSVASVLNTPVYVNGNGNHESPTSYDRSEYRSVYGSSGGGGGDSDDPQGSGNEIRKHQEKDESDGNEWHWEWRTLPYKKNTSLKLRKPRFLKGRRGKGLRYTYWLRHTSTSGVVTTYRVVKPGNRRGASAYFDVPSMEVACEVVDETATGEAGTKKRKAPRFAIVQEEVPTEDTTRLEPPDPSSLPDEAIRGGQQIPDAGRYLATVSGVLEGGGLTKQSPPGRNAAGEPHQDVALNQLLKVNLPSTLNLLRNAEVSRLDASGTPEDWTFAGTASNQPGYFRAEEGVLTLGAATTPSVMPSATARRVPYDPAEMPSVTVAGTIGAKAMPSGEARFSVRQLDEAGARVKDANNVDIPDLVVGSMAAAAEVPFSVLYGAGGIAPETAFLQPVAHLVGVTGGAEAYFKSLRVLPLPTDVRYVEEADDGATFDAAPDTPVSGQSFVAAAPAPEAEQVEPAEEEPPISVLSFEAGLAEWTEFGDAPGKGIQTGAAIHGANGYRVQDATTNTARNGGVERLAPELEGSPGALRGLYVFDQLPTYGWTEIHEIATAGGTNIARIRVGSGGGLSVRVNPVGSPEKVIPLGVTLPAGAVLDVEPIPTPGKNGYLTVGVGINGQRRVVFGRGFDFNGRSPGRMRAGAVANHSARTRYSLRFDQVVVTAAGDVLDREKPARPAGYTPPPLDRPLKAGLPRTFDHAERKIGQIYALLAPGAAPPDDPAIVPLLDDPIPVRPGLSYTVSAFRRSVGFGFDSPGLRAWLEAEDGTAEPYVAATIPFDAQGWHGTAEEDDFMVVPVPLEGGYDTLRLDLALCDGVHVAQEPLVSIGALTVFADRDAKRGGGRAAAGSGEWIFDLKPEGYEHGLNPGVFVSEFGVKESPASPDEETPVGSLATQFSTSQDLADWLPYNSPATSPLQYLRMALSFAGDGFGGPEAASLYARTWSPIGVLLRPDGTHLPGVAYIGNALSPSEYPDVEVRRVGGRLVLVPQSDPIGRLEDQRIFVGVSTEEARREVQYLSSIGPLIAEVPTLGGTVAGQALTVVFGERLKLAVGNVPPRIDPAIGRVLYAGGEAEYAEVLEAAPLQSPMKPVDFAPAVLSPAVGGA